MASGHAHEDRIIVGVDFGTTFSGVAFTYSSSTASSNDPSVVSSWPGGSNLTTDKVPSEMSYEIVTTKQQHKTEKIHWGYQIKQEQPRLRCLKLLLDPRQALPSYISREDLNKQLSSCSRAPEQAVSDFLTKLYTQAREAMINRYGQHMVSTTKIDVVLTVPAVWSDAAKDATRRAAIQAGMGRDLSTISEPEAAATYALKSLESSVMSVGDNFIVCDAGGGTVDLISYEISSLSPLRLSESVPGTGALCGAAFLNLRFQELLKSRMGPEVFEKMCAETPKAWPAALKYFEEHLKRTFDPSNSQEDYDDNTFNVQLPGVKDNVAAHICQGFITLSTAELTEIFRPVIDGVIGLVERQRNAILSQGKSAKGVILVGGLGQSNYLLKSLRSRFANESPPASYTPTEASTLESGPSAKRRKVAEKQAKDMSLTVLQPANAWTAVVRGAVLDRLEHSMMVTSRKSRRHYGVKCCSVFDHSKHSLGDRFWSSEEGIFRASNQTEWSIKKGQCLRTDQPILIPFITTWAMKKGYPKKDSSSIIVSDAAEAPQRFTETFETRDLCRLEVDLTKVPNKCFKTKTNPQGRPYRELDHMVGMTVNSGGITFDLRVDGIVYGAVSAEFE